VVLYNNRVGAGNRDGVGYIDINCSIVHVAHGMWAWHRAIHINSGCREIKCPNIRDQINLVNVDLWRGFPIYGGIRYSDSVVGVPVNADTVDRDGVESGARVVDGILSRHCKRIS
jgi:hypothetical protein